MRFLSRFHSVALDANELQGTGGVFQRRLYRRLNLVFDAVFHVAVVDRHDRDALVEKGFGVRLLVAACQPPP